MSETNKTPEFLDENERVEKPETKCNGGDSFARTGPAEECERQPRKNPEPARQDEDGGAGIELKPEDESGGQAQSDGAAGYDCLEPG